MKSKIRYIRRLFAAFGIAVSVFRFLMSGNTPHGIMCFFGLSHQSSINMATVVARGAPAEEVHSFIALRSVGGIIHGTHSPAAGFAVPNPNDTVH